MLTFFQTRKTQLKALEVKPEAVALTLVDGRRRRLTPSVFIQVTHAETKGDIETRHITLHSKRGLVSGALINWLKEYLREKGWSFQGVMVNEPKTGNWEAIFRK